MNSTELTNRLNESRSPYLLQHAQNPVHWQAWNDETLALAKEQDKPLLISIGYAACHWCHVMAHETFEDQASAHIMNQHFICIKVDREERPDVDSIYMQAVQMITGSGGWPLHVFALPDGRPFFGGTYFPREQWQQVCRSAAQAYQTNREEVTASADNLEKGLRVRVPVISTHPTIPFKQDLIHHAAESLQVRFDEKHGGSIGAPKFPMPALLNFLHDYSLLAGNQHIKAHVRFSLQKMSMGGIYDHVGGGFARYAVDSRWKVPHFEKMLYDNAQMLSLLSKAHRSDPSPLFEERIRETADFILRDLRTQEGLFASSLDADSEGVEGKYYVWDQEELKQILGDLYPTAQKVLNINPYGYWEKDNYILQMDKEVRDLADEMQIPLVNLHEQVKTIKARLFENRLKRKPPLLDDKALVSWNALAIMGLTDASIALNEPGYLSAAQQAADSILKKLRTKDGGLYHVFAGGTPYTTGFLEDYSQMISALIALYQSDLDPSHLNQAKTWMEYLFAHFLDPETGFFYFTRAGESRLIKRDIDLTDGVIPSANSVIAHSLLALAHFFGMPEWEEHARKMAANLADELEHYPGSYSHWAALYLKFAFPFYDISISGDQTLEYLQQLRKTYRPNTLFAGSLQKSELPVLSNRYQAGQTLVYVCRDKVCEKPLASIDDVNRILPAA